MIENSMFEEEPDVVDLAKEPCLHPLEPDEVEYEPRGSRLLVRGLGEHDLEEDEEDCESSAKLLGMSFMNRSSGLRNTTTGYRQGSNGPCSVPSARTMAACAFVVMIAVSVIMVIYLLPKCTFTKEGCYKKNQSMRFIQTQVKEKNSFPWAHTRLPTTIKPLRYEVNLHPNLTSMTFTGSVTILLQALQAKWNIILHSKGHNISKATIRLAVASEEHNVEVVEYNKTEQLAIIVPEALLEGHNYTLKLEFSAKISPHYYGFYGFTYTNEKNEKKLFAGTQFEPLGLRTVFPCFDEPAFKATFLIRIIRNKEHSAISNMPKKSSVVLENGLVQDEFYESVKMSTYLVAFVVGEIKNLSQEVNGTLVSIYGIPERIDQFHHALGVAVKVFEFFQNYFEVPYSINKLDLAAIPTIYAGAMENWGLITFQEQTLLHGTPSFSVTEIRLLRKIMAHEIAHQWLGNLVTMQWWNDLWLNEGFATFMEYFSLEKIADELSVYEELLENQFRYMKIDCLKSSQPMSSPASSVESLQQIGRMFEPINYFKGASLLLMLKTYVGEDVFQHALIRYLKKHSFSSIQNDDLWDNFNEVTGPTLDVKRIMKTWTLQNGLPLVTVQRKGRNVTVHQEKFIMKPEIQPSNESYLWEIPLSYITDRTNNSQYPSVFLLTKESDTIILPEEVEWIKFNVDMNGYYMVHYTDDWEALIKQLNTNPYVFSDKDRANLINNIFVLAGIGKVPLQQAFELIAYLGNETHNAPITEALYQTRFIFDLLEKVGHLDLASRLENRVLNLLHNQIQQQTWTDDGSLSMRDLRSKLLGFACTHNLKNCTTVAMKLFDDWMSSNGTQSIPLDVMSTVFKVGAKTEKGWSFLLSAYDTENSEGKKEMILKALASTADIRNLYRLMKISLDGNRIPTFRLSAIVQEMSQSLLGHLLAWNFVKENWDVLVQKLAVRSYPMRGIIAALTHMFSTKTRLSEVRGFFETQPEDTFKYNSIQDGLEVIQLNIQWMEKNLQALTLWL
ncbi:PREDICTED: leucyl-cystinyl aminopeptidase [Elephantulus edwardii]|uniref:leucyl-cystinyl aminopeptidase n=1 Tax=Elephantulus edwardii TaxID=28737 RepID=UPI0003F0E787|nr:PREDICTED: leucyl-cystinyl aminopeptidase [Elephantulus edwardii]